jgi:hypothetical protein
LFDDIESVAAGHLYIEKEERGPAGSDSFDGFRSGSAFPNDGNCGIVSKEVRDCFPRKRLVVDDQRANFHYDPAPQGT